MSAVRTPGPWAIVADGGAVEIFATNPYSRIAELWPKANTHDDAMHIVESANNYERVCAERGELAEALKRFCDVYESDSPLRPAAMVNECRKAREALAKVRL